MTSLPVVVILSLAAFRITRLITTDDIFQPVRNLWFRWFPEGTKPAELASCNYCVGFWVSALVLLVAHLVGLARWPVRYDLVLWWAVAGLQSLFSATDARLAE